MTFPWLFHSRNVTKIEKDTGERVRNILYASMHKACKQENLKMNFTSIKTTFKPQN